MHIAATAHRTSDRGTTTIGSHVANGTSVLLVLATLLLTASARAQAVCDGPVAVSPPAPTSQTPVTLQFEGFIEACSTMNYYVTGNVITVENEWECVVASHSLTVN